MMRVSVKGNAAVVRKGMSELFSDKCKSASDIGRMDSASRNQSATPFAALAAKGVQS